MERLDWKDEYSVGVAEIDRQHQSIFRLVNKIVEADDPETNAELFTEAVDQLVEYVREHFALEESLMEQCEFEDYERHLQFHLDFVHEVMRLTERTLDADKDALDDLGRFLHDWWTNHILVEDRAYVATFRENGIT